MIGDYTGSLSIIKYKDQLPIYIRGFFTHSNLSNDKRKKHKICGGYRFVIVYYIGSKWIRIIDPFDMVCGNYTLKDFITVLPKFIIHKANWSNLLRILKEKVAFYDKRNENADKFAKIAKAIDEYKPIEDYGELDLDAPGADGIRKPVPLAGRHLMNELEKRLICAY